MQKMGGPELAADYRKRLCGKMAKHEAMCEQINKHKLKAKRLQGDYNQWQDERDKLRNEIKELKNSLVAKDELNEEERRKLQEEVEKANKKVAELQEKLKSMQRQVEILASNKEELRNTLSVRKQIFNEVVTASIDMVAVVAAGALSGKYIFHSLLM